MHDRGPQLSQYHVSSALMVILNSDLLTHNQPTAFCLQWILTSEGHHSWQWLVFTEETGSTFFWE